MAANVESMFYVRETPWHGLGTKVQEAPTSKDALILAGLDWHVLQEPVYTGQNELVQGYKANVRDIDRKVLGVVTDRYKIIQNEEAFAFTDELLGEGVRYETAGSLQGGKCVWLLAHLPHEYIISGERISPYLLLPDVITPERFTRMALSALNTTPKLQECTPMSFLAALMNAAQLGLEPNTPLGQAFLIPYNNKKKGIMECQFQLGYKGLIDLSYRNPNMQIVAAHTVYENDEFEYELGLNPCLNHRPTLEDRGEIRLFYGLFKLTNGGFGFEVMSKTAMDDFAREYSKGFDSLSSPWKTNYESMALKTIIKKALKYAPLVSEFRRALSTDETIKNEIGEDMTVINGENIYDTVYQEECA